MLGRVSSSNYFIVAGGNCVGALLGGTLARQFGITAPYWVAFAVAVLVSAATWRVFSRAAVAAAYSDPPSLAAVGIPGNPAPPGGEDSASHHSGDDHYEQHRPEGGDPPDQQHEAPDRVPDKQPDQEPAQAAATAAEATEGPHVRG